MTFGQQLLFFFSAIGAFNGLLLGIYLLLAKKERNLPNLFLGILLLTLSIRVSISVCFYFYPDWPRIISYLGLASLFYTGPALLGYIRSSYLTEDFDLKSFTKLFVTLTLFLAIVSILYVFFPVSWDRYYGTFVYAVWSVFVFLSIYSYYRFSASKVKSSNRFILPVLISNLIIFLAYQLISTGWVQIYCAGGSLVFSFVLYANFLIFFERREKRNVSSKVSNKYPNKKISDESAENFNSKLRTLMYSEELYKNPDLKLNDLAVKMNMPSHQLSQLLNDNIGKSFSTYVNEFRINEACDKIEKGSALKIEEIGYEVGFNSKSTFFNAFRKIKHTTPFLYKQSQTISHPVIQSSDL
ncbi:helix-turn-helix domain-containing protein [Sphingobacterium sp.]|uniref:helix-turn-helix domain-containing protein n=1 Tax=Sphingobacterium sp. TaxID=341027 RepID=UPI00289A2429|nr:helix-turn-helix domain-containing protein [Sphingobacterium sp.]